MMAPRRLEPAVENSARTWREALHLDAATDAVGTRIAVRGARQWPLSRRAPGGGRSLLWLRSIARAGTTERTGRVGTFNAPGGGDTSPEARGSWTWASGTGRRRGAETQRAGVRCDALRRRASTLRTRMRGHGTWQPAHDRRRLSVARRACYSQATAPIAGVAVGLRRPCQCQLQSASLRGRLPRSPEADQGRAGPRSGAGKNEEVKGARRTGAVRSGRERSRTWTAWEAEARI